MKPFASRLAILSATALMSLALTSITGCANPRNTIIPTNADSVDSVSESVKKLSPEDRQLFAGYFVRHVIGSKMGGMFGIKATPIAAGTTVGQAIDEQRAYIANESVREAEEKALKEKVLKAREEAMNVMRSAVTVTLVSKELVTDKSYGIVTDQKLQIVFAYRNNTDKAVVGVKGTADVNDLFGDELSGFAISNDTSIAPGATITWTGSRSVKYGMNSANDEKLADLPDDKYKVIWKPKMVIFADGTRLTAPDEG